MHSKHIIGLASLTLIPCWALAESGITLNADTVLHLTLSNQLRYDDNVTLSHNSSEDTIFLCTPGAELIYNGGLSKASLNLYEQFSRYADHGDYNGENLSLLSQYAYEGALTTVTAHLNYQELTQGSLTVRNADQAVERDVTDSAVDAQWAMSEKTHFGAGVFYHSTNYTSSSYADTYCYGAPLDAYYAVTPKVDLSVGYRYRRTIVDELATTTVSQDTRDHFFNVGARGEFTPKLKGQVRVGYNVRDLDEVLPGEDGTEEQFAFSSSLSYVYSPKTTFTLEAANDFDNSSVGTSQKVLSVRAGATWELSPELTFGGGLSYQATRYDSGQNDDFFVGDMEVAYSFSENFSVNAQYVYRQNWSTYLTRDFSGNVLSVGATIRF